ncbi:lantibiotic dehydratase [Streptomyces cathayae]|uniref:Lantibiotic dehydratase n=1 Tax=Streptomyces cathayae TaxID=3031124 RepID=A0ABY8JVR5_9ACTN|nr:lantibiotic dehydratase [Streptomyces sp. HUAS 5]WGD38796.1 lantibiotic dehydratase [Streptomyces sp. HUAS 5]
MTPTESGATATAAGATTDTDAAVPTDTGPDAPTDTGPDAAAEPGTRWELGRRFMLRAAGLPIETVHGLRCPGTRRWADAVLAEEERLTAAGAALSDLLHALVKSTTGPEEDPGDAAVRRGLLNLRRQVFNNRLPADTEAAVQLVTEQDPETGRRTARWLHDRARLEELRATGADLLAGELQENRRVLREVLTDDRLRLGLLLASPALDGRLDAYLRDTSPRPGNRLRKIERSALTYLYRTACKTSPFSTFTGIGLGTFTGGPSDGGAALRTGEDWVSHVRLNVVALARLTELITADPGRRQDLPVVLSPGWGRDADRIRYVRHVMTAGDDSAAVTFDAVRDRLFYLRSSGTLERLLEWLGAQDVPVRHRDLVAWLETGHDAGREECERYASALLDLGMVQVPVLRADVHGQDPLRSYQDALRSLGVPWADRLARLLDGPADCLARYPGAGVGKRRTLLSTLRGHLLDAQRELGAAEPALPQTLVYEDVDTGGDLTCGPAVLGGETGRALQAVEGILPLFDLTLPQRITLLGFFTARYGRGGRCDDLLGLVHDFHEDFFDQYVSFTSRRASYDENGTYLPEENWLGQSEMKALDRARRHFHEGMKDLWRRHGTVADADAEEIELPDRLLSGTADELAPLTRDFTPQSHHIQLSRPPGGRPLVVLNKSYGGLAFPFSRFTHLHDGATADTDPAAPGFSDTLREEMAARRPPGAVFAEVTGGPVSSNLNLHGRLTDHQIVCPGETSTVPEDARIHLDDLYIQHDERAGRLVLRSRRLGREVVPVYLGYLVPIALPEIPRTLLLLSPSTMAPFDVWAGVPEGEAENGVTRRPRVRHKDVVVGRRSWTADAECLPARRPGAGEEEHYLEYRRWQRVHGLPDRCFATVSHTDQGPIGAKPVHVDFDSPLSLSAFEALVERRPGTRVTFREMLPAEDGLHLTSRRGRHVAELAVETFTTRRLPQSEPEATPSCPN